MKMITRLLVTVIAIGVTACGSTATDDAATAEQADAPAPTTAAPEEDTSSGPPDWELGIPAEVPAGRVELPAAGGVSFEMTEQRFIFQQDTFFAITDPEAPEGTSSAFGIKIHGFVNDDAPVTSGADVLSALEEASFLTIEELSAGIEIDGVQFAGYRIESTIAAGALPPTRLFSAAEPGGPDQLFWYPNPVNVIFIGDSDDGGALVFGYEGPDEDRLDHNRVVFEEILPTLSLK